MLSLDMKFEALREAILSLLAERDRGKSICPSEAARRAYAGTDDGWRALMPAVRAEAAELADQGIIDATQRGAVVSLRTARGPIRLRYRSE